MIPIIVALLAISIIAMADLYRIKPKDGSHRIGNRIFSPGVVYSVDWNTAKAAKTSKRFDMIDDPPKKKPAPSPEDKPCDCGPFEGCEICGGKGGIIAGAPKPKPEEPAADTDKPAADTPDQPPASAPDSADQPEKAAIPEKWVKGLQDYDDKLVKDAPAYLAALTNPDFVEFLADNAAKTGSREHAAARLAEMQG